MMEFKDALRRRREYLGLTPEQLANIITRCGAPTTAADVQYWERGRNSAPLDNPLFRQSLAAALQIPVEKIERSMRILDREPPALPVPEFSGLALRCADLIDQMPDHLRIMAVNILETMLRSSDIQIAKPTMRDMWD